MDAACWSATPHPRLLLSSRGHPDVTRIVGKNQQHFSAPLGALKKYGPKLLHECLNDGTPGDVTSSGQLHHDFHTGKVSLSDLNAAFGQQKKDADESTVVSKVPGAPGGALDPAPEKFLLLCKKRLT